MHTHKQSPTSGWSTSLIEVKEEADKQDKHDHKPDNKHHIKQWCPVKLPVSQVWQAVIFVVLKCTSYCSGQEGLKKKHRTTFERVKIKNWNKRREQLLRRNHIWVNQKETNIVKVWHSKKHFLRKNSREKITWYTHKKLQQGLVGHFPLCYNVMCHCDMPLFYFLVHVSCISLHSPSLPNVPAATCPFPLS